MKLCLKDQSSIKCAIHRTTTNVRLSTHTQIIFEMSVFFMHDDFIYRNPLLISRLNFTVIFTQDNRPECWQGEVEQVAKRRMVLLFDD